MWNFDAILQTAIMGLVVGFIYSLVAMGYAVVFNATRILNFSQGAYVMLGGMLTYAFYTHLKLPIYLAALFAMVAVTGVGVLTHRLVIEPMWRRRAPIYMLVLVTFGVLLLIENATLLSLGSLAVAFPPFTKGDPWHLLGATITQQMVWIVAFALLGTLALNLLYRKTMLGKAMRACAVNRDAATLMGINVDRIILYSFALSGIVGALAGIVITPAQLTAFNVGLPYNIKGFAAAIVGGFGSLPGAVAGGLILGLVESFGVLFVSSVYKDVIIYVLLFLILLARPSGLFQSLVEDEQI